LCWEHLGDIKYIFMKNKPFFFSFFINLFREAIFYIHRLCMQVHSKKYYSDLKKKYYRIKPVASRE